MDNSRTQDKFVIRLPDGLRPEIASTARFNQRSMNGEIIFRLQRSIDIDHLQAVQSSLITQLLKRIDELELLNPNLGCITYEDRLKAVNQLAVRK